MYSSGTRAAAGLVGLGLGQLTSYLHRSLSRQNLIAFYTLEFLLNAFYVLIVIKVYQVLIAINFCGNQRKVNKDQKSY